ncbi:F-type H+-transporting ATPase subunit a [Bacilli bacterium PM5-3]|nr:F-type H+-transporting ATPase subunit a [Bacilli bacterium PM5-3]MDH6603697.1 F-type H+-transporting ATPase subunit a [Bacilli bacterium PM5-9]
MEIINKYVEAQSEQTWVFMGIAFALSILFVIGGKYIDKQDPMKKPSKFMIIVDVFYGFIFNLYNSIFKGHCKSILPYSAMLIILLFTMNWIGLFLPVAAPATDYNVPLSLVIISFGFRYALEFKHMGIGAHIKSYFDPIPVMFPLNLMDIVAKPLSMSMRLFGNILSGSLILSVYYSAMDSVQNSLLGFIPMNADGTPIISLLGGIVGPPLHFYFDMFSGTIQAFVFTLLTLIFSSLALDLDEMDEKAEKGV